MSIHYESKHPNQNMPSEYVVSSFEEKSVEYVSINGYLPDDQYKLLLSQYKTETLKLFGDREKEKAEKKRKLKKKRRIKRRNDVLININ